jgi:hypothetical protein
MHISTFPMGGMTLTARIQKRQANVKLCTTEFAIMPNLNCECCAAPISVPEERMGQPVTCPGCGMQTGTGPAAIGFASGSRPMSYRGRRVTPRDVDSPEPIGKVKSNWSSRFEPLEQVSDRVCAVVAMSFVERALSELLRNRFVESRRAKELLDSRLGGALSSLRDATGVAYCIGLISKECRDNIDRLGVIRSRVCDAAVEHAFGETRVAKWCNKLALPGTNVTSRLVVTEGAPETVNETPRSRFTYVAHSLCVWLGIITIECAREKAKRDIWEVA